MWSLSDEKVDTSDIALITNAWQNLLYYDGPILFTGFNALKNRILGSLILYEAETKQQKYVHAVIDNTTYADYLSGKVSYPSVLRKARLLYAVVWTKGDKQPTTYRIQFEDIPAQYRPDEDAFCPELDWEPSHVYPIKLDGKLAAYHQSTPEIIGQVSKYIADLFRAAINRLSKDLNLNAAVRLIAGEGQLFTPSSFQINYNISIDQPQRGLFDKEGGYFEYLNSFVTYCIYDLPQDAPQLANNDLKTLKGFERLCEQYVELRGIGRVGGSAAIEDVRGDLLRAFDALQSISSTVGPFYSEIAFANISKEGDAKELGVIDEAFNATLEEAALAVDAASDAAKEEIDTEPKSYQIYIYALNTDARSGFAQIAPPVGVKKPSRPKIKILGTKSLTGTMYTNSLDNGEYIEVKAKAKKVGGVIKSLEIVFEDEEN